MIQLKKVFKAYDAIVWEEFNTSSYHPKIVNKTYNNMAIHVSTIVEQLQYVVSEELLVRNGYDPNKL